MRDELFSPWFRWEPGLVFGTAIPSSSVAVASGEGSLGLSSILWTYGCFTKLFNDELAKKTAHLFL